MASIIVPEQFIQATRDVGYRSLAYALAELIDNAIDADASRVDIRISETRGERFRQIRIAVLDDGRGMHKAGLWEALRFGGSERFNGRSTLGRYGMGLPGSSVSQARRVDVYTWQEAGPALHTSLDVCELARGGSAGIPEPRVSALPNWVRERSTSGTLVVWSRCDRLPFKKATTLVRKLRTPLGQMYRVPLSRGLVLRLNDLAVAPVDPLFRSSCPLLPGKSKRYGDPLRYRIATPRGDVSSLTVRFVELPVQRWHSLPVDVKRRAGLMGRAGMSVLRADREIDYGWYLFGKKQRDKYDDWWRCELRFEPDIDEFAGITLTKQRFKPSRTLRSLIGPDLEEIAFDLNRRVRTAFRNLPPVRRRAAVDMAAERDRLLPPVRSANSQERRSGLHGYRFEVNSHSQPERDFFRVRLEGAALHLDINEHHPFFDGLYKQPRPRPWHLDLLLISAGRALLDLPESDRSTFLRGWSDNLHAFLVR